MSRYRVVHPGNLPPRLPVAATAVLWLLLDRVEVPGLWRGVAWTIMGLFWVVLLVAWWIVEPVRIFPREEP